MSDYLWPAPYAVPAKAPRRPTGKQIISSVAQRHGLTAAELLGPSRRRAICWPRQEAMWEMREQTTLSLPQIAHILGGLDHTTIIHGIRAHEARIAPALPKH